MKMTMHIDHALLERVMETTGASSKTAAINLARGEMDRRARLVKLSHEGPGVSAEELRDAIDPNYDLDETRRRETPATHARKSRSR